MSIKENKENNENMIELQLGDVIHVSDATNEKLDDQTFIIDYIDSSKMFLINTDTLDNIKLKILEDGTIGNGTITKIAILSRSDEKGYALQNNLTPSKWINIHFGGEYPAIITGEITNLENDMIEVKTVDGDVLYINFDYKGIPEDLPITLIEIREKPQESMEEGELQLEEELEEGEIQEEQAQVEELEEGELLESEAAKNVQMMNTRNLDINAPVKNIKDQLREFVLRADQIKFGDEELGPIVQYVDVSSKSQRYSIETQVTDLLDDLLSNIPDAERSARVLNSIHTTIERFKQLREQFSSFDKNGNIERSLVYEANYKPIWNYFNDFNINLYWLLPVVKNIKKLYADTGAERPYYQDQSVIDTELTENLEKMSNIIQDYRSNSYPTEQNKYAHLNAELNPYFTPFELINNENESDIIINKTVDSNITTIVDNLDDMYSTIFNNGNIRNRRFVIQKYNLGPTKLDTIEQTGSRLITTRVKMANSDTMSIKSFLTLPEPTIRYSRINLPNTSLLDKANLNRVSLNYWQLLNKKTPIYNVFVDKIDESIEFDEDNFVNNIKNYILNLSENDKRGLSDNQIYYDFIKTIMPKTKVIFDLMKKYIIGKLSIIDVVGYLEPFLIYPDNLTYMQYKDIIQFIDTEISKYNKDFIEKSKEMRGLNDVKFRKATDKTMFSSAYSIINIILDTNNIQSDVFSGYEINLEDIKKYKLYTNSELLRKITIKDANKLYTSAISLQNIPLMFPSDFTSLLDNEKNNLNTKRNEAADADDCKSIIVAKQYKTYEELQQDNNKTIYFDKKYDTTNYGLLDKYEDMIIKLSPENFMNHLIQDLTKSLKINTDDAELLSDTLINGFKKVQNGNYAILYKEYTESTTDKTEYYVRKDNKWILDKTPFLKNAGTDDAGVLCNLQNKCVSVPAKYEDKCESIPLDKLTMQNKLLKDVIAEFDDKYNLSKQDMLAVIKSRYEYNLSLIDVLTRIDNIQFLKYNRQKYKLGSTDDSKTNRIVSPNAKLLNLILSQSDFVKKQMDTIRFVNTYTRPAITENFGPLGQKESGYWLYCLKTNTPLLPIFKFTMATAYITDTQNYNNFVDLLISDVGKLSDDGHLWIDEHSGWTIRPIDDEYDEGYDGGFKVSSRAVLENDAGNKITSSTTVAVQYSTPESRTVSNIVNALSIAMGINIEVQKEFIINIVLASIRDTLESESDYKTKVKEMAEKNKKIMSYKDFYNNAIMYYTMGAFLIAVQTAIPSVRTRKTHPGCIRSFSGFPLEGSGDNTALNYVACVAYDIRSSSDPWYVLKGKKQDVVMNKIKLSITGVLLNIAEVKRKIDDKIEYLLTGDNEEIPVEHNILAWTHFLPPLIPFKVDKLTNISGEFKSALMSDLKSGANSQRDKILVVLSKITLFSLAIQEKIQEVVKKQDLLLNKGSNEPYLENSCCSSNDKESTIQYFMNKNKDILEYNQVVQNLTNILSDITAITKSAMFYSNLNTKNVYPSISNTFSEKTIYLTFIYFCKFKSLMPIPENLLPLCANKPDMLLINETDTIDEIIRKLKHDGRDYNYETFLRLLQLISRENIININIQENVISPIIKLSAALQTFDTENDEIIDSSLRNLMLGVLDTYDIATDEVTKETKDLNNYLIKQTALMKTDIVDFIRKNKGVSITASLLTKTARTINQLSTWSTQEQHYTIINFYKTFIHDFVSLFPNIVLNKVQYKNTVIPSYVGVSQHHSRKIQLIISDYYKNLQRFYGTPEIIKVLNTIQSLCANIVKLADVTSAFTTIHYKDKTIHPIFDERTSLFLFEYLLLKVLITYIDLTDEDNMIVREIQQRTTGNELFTEEFLEDNETKVDFMNTDTIVETQLLSGNKKSLRQQVAHLLSIFIELMDSQKDIIDVSYSDIMDKVLKLREREKDIITDRLQLLSDEERDADTILKINKLGVWSKGLQKGLTQYVKETYDEERELRDDMDKLERKLRATNKNVTDDNIDEYVTDYMEQQQVDNEIEREENNMNNFTDDYNDGNFDGDEVENYEDYDS
jgi:hypothetical protein